MRERPEDKAKRLKQQAFDRELSLVVRLKETEGYVSERKLISMMNTNAKLRETRGTESPPWIFPVDADDLEAMIKEILKWRRGMLTRHDLKRYFSR